MAKKTHKLNLKTINEVRNRAIKRSGNDLANKIILVCNYAEEQLKKGS